jgi:thiol-disulfide isomerase/thioredoxin
MLDFEFPDTNGKLVKLSDFKGKTVFLDFWYTGCGACTYFYTNVLSQVEKELHGKGVEFVTISIDAGRDYWLKSVKGGRYTSELATNLYTGGVGYGHKLIKHYGIDSYPTFVVVDRDGKIESFNAKELHIRDSANLVNILKQVSTQ